MAIPRSLLVDPDRPLCYHLVSRCVRHAWLCGMHEGRSFDHRKSWIEQRILHLAKAFSVDILAYAVMSNHFHVVVYYDPGLCRQWSDEEVATRWFHAFGGRSLDKHDAREALLRNPERLERCRLRLGSLSAFMQHLKQPIAVRVNREDEVTGHLFEQRFYSGALLDESATLAAMRYVDLNPVRARITDCVRTADHTSIARRLRVRPNSSDYLDSYLGAVSSGATPKHSLRRSEAGHPAVPSLTLRDYVRLLEVSVAEIRGTRPERAASPGHECWPSTERLFRKRQRAYGGPTSLERWLALRQFRAVERPLPVVA